MARTVARFEEKCLAKECERAGPISGKVVFESVFEFDAELLKIDIDHEHLSEFLLALDESLCKLRSYVGVVLVDGFVEVLHVDLPFELDVRNILRCRIFLVLVAGRGDVGDIQIDSVKANGLVATLDGDAIDIPAEGLHLGGEDIVEC